MLHSPETLRTPETLSHTGSIRAIVEPDSTIAYLNGHRQHEPRTLLLLNEASSQQLLTLVITKVEQLLRENHASQAMNELGRLKDIEITDEQKSKLINTAYDHANQIQSSGKDVLGPTVLYTAEDAAYADFYVEVGHYVGTQWIKQRKYRQA